MLTAPSSAPALAGMSSQESAAFFDEIRQLLTHQVRTDELLLATNTAPPATARFYQDLRDKNFRAMTATSRAATTWYFIKELLVDYLVALQQHPTPPRTLAVDFSDSKVHFWAEIADDDFLAKRALLRAQAKVNAVYHPYGFHVASMIVEAGDHLPVPAHYHVFEPSRTA